MGNGGSDLGLLFFRGCELNVSEGVGYDEVLFGSEVEKCIVGFVAVVVVV
jgi:hypothetical protein